MVVQQIADQDREVTLNFLCDLINRKTFNETDVDKDS